MSEDSMHHDGGYATKTASVTATTTAVTVAKPTGVTAGRFALQNQGKQAVYIKFDGTAVADNTSWRVDQGGSYWCERPTGQDVSIIASSGTQDCVIFWEIA